MKIILFRGRPGTGKTTLSTAVAEKLDLPILRKDDLYDPVAAYVMEHQDRNEVAYGVLYKILESNKAFDIAFILDVPFAAPEHFELIKNWCSAHDVAFKSILVVCSDEKIWAERINKRKIKPAPNQLLTDYQEMKEYYGNLFLLKPFEEELLIDTTNPLERSIFKIVDFVLNGH